MKKLYKTLVLSALLGASVLSASMVFAKINSSLSNTQGADNKLVYNLSDPLKDMLCKNDPRHCPRVVS